MMGIQGIERNGSGENPVSNRNHRQHITLLLFQPLLLVAKLLTNSRFRIFLGSFCAEDFLYLFDVQEIIGQYEF